MVEGPHQGAPCVLPFYWADTGRTYSSCVFEPARGDLYPWCSVSRDGEYGGGALRGKCHPERCPVDTTCRVVDGPSKHEPCVFPFAWKATGKTYSKCAFEPGQGDEAGWCSTRVDGSGNHVTGGQHWGTCDPVLCPLHRLTGDCKCGLAPNNR